MAERTIYLAKYAKNQLEQSDNARIWARPIPYSNKVNEQFTLEYRFDTEDLNDNDGIDPTDLEYFYPDRTDPDTTIERLVKVNPLKHKRKKVIIKPGDKITMYLHGAGVISEEKVVVKKIGRKYLHIEASEGSPNKFDMKTGKCLNDIDPQFAMGFYRTIDKVL
jgi:hypothetical protein